MKIKKYIVFIVVGTILLIFFIDSSRTLLTAGEITLEPSVPDWYEEKIQKASKGDLSLKKLLSKRFETLGLERFEWSPDGERIVFMARKGFECEHIWLMDSNGHNRVRLTKDGCYHYQPAWNPEGNKIVYRVFTGPDKGIYTINLIEKSKFKAIIDDDMEFSRIIIFTLFVAIVSIISFALYSFKPFKIIEKKTKRPSKPPTKEKKLALVSYFNVQLLKYILAGIIGFVVGFWFIYIWSKDAVGMETLSRALSRALGYAVAGATGGISLWFVSKKEKGIFQAIFFCALGFIIGGVISEIVMPFYWIYLMFFIGDLCNFYGVLCGEASYISSFLIMISIMGGVLFGLFCGLGLIKKKLWMLLMAGAVGFVVSCMVLRIFIDLSPYHYQLSGNLINYLISGLILGASLGIGLYFAERNKILK